VTTVTINPRGIQIKTKGHTTARLVPLSGRVKMRPTGVLHVKSPTVDMLPVMEQPRLADKLKGPLGPYFSMEYLC
jgi:hypothetical protein